MSPRSSWPRPWLWACRKTVSRRLVSPPRSTTSARRWSPAIGAKVLKKRDCGSDLPVIVCFEHHIKYDGTGYPKISSRGPLHPVSYITQIADVFDALRTYRPYRDSLDLKTTLSIMERGRGTEVEPHFFDNFLPVVLPDHAVAGADPLS